MPANGEKTLHAEARTCAGPTESEAGDASSPDTPAKLPKLQLSNILVSTIIFPCCLSEIIAATCFTAGVTANEHTEIKMHSNQRSHKEPEGFYWLLGPKTEYYIFLGVGWVVFFPQCLLLAVLLKWLQE